MLSSRIRPLTSCYNFPSSILQKRSIIIKSKFKYIEPKNISFSEQLLKRIWRHGYTNPSKSAIINAFNPEERLSFHDLYLRSLSISTFLHQKCNFKHGNCVATVLPNLIDFPAIVLGTALIGGFTTPASSQLTSKELEIQFKDSKASIIFCADFTLEKVLEAAKNCPKIKKIICLKSGLLPDDSPEVILPRNVISYETIKHLEPQIFSNNVEINTERDIFLLPYSRLVLLF
uniref:AMP-dependent synthetase/ligase domain-containing protein n=1 Tax=Panagrolaimus davidi TaxID=227884 RepID=A0A914QDL4_9BILA